MPPIRPVITACLALFIAACGGGGSGGNADNELALRVLHASPDAPLFNILLDNRLIASSVDYRQGTSFLLLTPRAYDIAVDAIVPSGTDRVVELENQPLESDNEYTVIAVGLTAQDTIQSLLITNPIESIAAGTFRLQVVHGLPGGTPVDIYATAVGADLAASAPFATLAFAEYSPRVSLPAGEYQVRITPAGDPATVLFDSGAANFGSNDDLLAIAAPNTGTGDSPITVLVNNGVVTLPLFDLDTQTEIRVLNLTPDGDVDLKVTAADPVDNVPNVDLTAAFPTGLPFAQATGYTELSAQDYKFRAEDFDTPGTALLERPSATFFPNQRATFLTVGLLANISSVILFDDVRPVATEGKLRVINGAAAATAVDVYITTPGQALGSATPVVRSLGLGTASSYLSVAPNNYQVTFTTPGTTTVLAQATTSSVAGSAFTAIVHDNPGGGTPLAVIVENDLP